MKSLGGNLKVPNKTKHSNIFGVALCCLAISPLGQRAEAVVVLDNTPASQGFNQFAAPANPNDGGTYILSRGYAFQAGNLDYSIDSVSAFLIDVFSPEFNNSIVPTARLELRSFDGSNPGSVLEALPVSITNPNFSNTLSTFSVPAWNLSANSSYWIGLNWASPFNQGNSNVASSALFGWSVASSSPTLGSGFADLGFWQFVVGPNSPPLGSWAKVSCDIQCNSFRVNASPNIAHVPAPLPIIGLAAAFAYSRKLRKRLRDYKGSAVSSI